MSKLRPLAGLLVAGVVVFGCKESTTPAIPVPTSVLLSATTVNLTALGATQQLTATVRDQNDQAMSGQTVTWVSDDPAVAQASASGLVTAVGNGQTTVRATSGSLDATANVSVQQMATQIARIAGDGQTAQVGSQLPTALEVEIRDSRGNPVPGGTGGQVVNTAVGFSVTQGGGSVAQTQVTIAANGRGSTSWTLGNGAGSGHQVTVSLSGGAGSTTFGATATAAAADSLGKVSGDGQTGTQNAALTDSIVTRVVDPFGNPVAGHPVRFSVLTGGGSVSPDSVNTRVDGTARTEWTLGAPLGPQTMQAEGVGLTKGSPATFSATAIAQITTNLAKFDGDNQTGLVAKAVNVPPAAKVEDQFGNGVPGITVTFTVTGGGGSVTGGTAVSDANGIARVGSWTLGGTIGANALQAAASGVTPVTFNATGQTAQFDIVVRYFGATTPTANQQAAFTAAAQRWEALIFGDLQDAVVNAPAGSCGNADFPAVSETVDDLIIYAKVDSIDGPGGVLGQAGPCFIRSATSTHPTLPGLGIMRFDRDDLANLEASGQLNRVILHEMGHVLGFGTLWNQSPFTLLANPCPGATPPPCTTDPHFVGARGIAAFDRVGGATYTASQKVPIENTGGLGTINGHWRESVFNTELMTGFLDSGANPLTLVSLGSLWDMNYLVNYADADTYVLPPAPPPGAALMAQKLDLGDDIYRGPLYEIDPATGRIVRVIRP